MKRVLTSVIALSLIGMLWVSAGCSQGPSEEAAAPAAAPSQPSVETAVQQDESSGEELFMEHCTPCHPEGGNIINPKKTLHREDREAHNVKTVDDIIHTMRNPGPGMAKVDPALVPDKDAKKIAEYIIKTFK